MVRTLVTTSGGDSQRTNLEHLSVFREVQGKNVVASGLFFCATPYRLLLPHASKVLFLALSVSFSFCLFCFVRHSNIS